MISSISEQEYNSLYNTVYGYFYRRVQHRDICEDLTAETLHTFITSEQYEVENWGYLWGIAKNKLYQQYRTHKVQTYEIHESDAIIDQVTNEFSVRMNMLLDCVKNATTPQEFALVQDAVLNDFSSKELSEKLNAKPAAIRKRLSRTVAKLRETCKKLWK